MWQCMELGPAWARSKHVVEKIRENTLKIFTTRLTPSRLIGQTNAVTVDRTD